MTDPCPLCEGTGAVVIPATLVGDETQPGDPPNLGRLLAVLPRLTPAERQRLYDELHARYDCRIYRS